MRYEGRAGRTTIPGTRPSASNSDELEQALTAAEDARDEAARLARELEETKALLAGSEQALMQLRAEAERRVAHAEASLRDRSSAAEELQVAIKELQVTMEKLQVSNEALAGANEKLEECVAERTAALRTSEARLAAIFAQAEVGLAEVGAEGRFTRVNDRFCAMLGRSREELLDLRVWDVTHPDELRETRLLFHRLAETGEMFTTDKRYLRPDGSHIWVNSTVGRIVAPDGHPLGMLAVTVDLTRRRAAEAALRSARDEEARARSLAEEANRSRSRFLASVSHDLRQPVMAANLFASLLRKRPLGSRERELVGPLADSLASLTGMLTGLLDVARLDAGIVTAEFRDFPLDELLERLRGEFQGLADEARLDLTIPRTRTTVRSDPMLVELVLRNLVSNAIKFTHHGSITVEAKAEGDLLRISVTDTGPGIPAGEIGRIFEDYFQLGKTAKDHSRGFGIGLSTVRRVADLLGTQVQVRSEVGRGSTFSLALPLANARDRDRPAAAPQGVLGGLSVLIVDDEPLVLKALEMWLKEQGAQVHAARAIREAAALLSGLDAAPAAIVADYTLAQGERGTDAIEAARRHGVGAAVLITGDTSAERMAEATRSGYRLLHKPVNPDELAGLLAELVGKG
jgi:two-component system, sensor histidine kinase